MELKPTNQIKIYRDGQFSRWETIQPALKNHAYNAFEKVNYWFANGHWPSLEEQSVDLE